MKRGMFRVHRPIPQVEIGTAFPAIVAISCENPDGVYRGETLTFKVSFDRCEYERAGLLTFAGGASTLTASIQESAADTTALYFERDTTGRQ